MSENPLENEYHLRKQAENLEVNRTTKPMTREQLVRQSLLLKVGFTEENKALSTEALQALADDLNYRYKWLEENPYLNEYAGRKAAENIEANNKRRLITREEFRRQALLLKVGFTDANKTLSTEELQALAADLNRKPPTP